MTTITKSTAQTIYAEACEAAKAAVDACTPTPIVVGTAKAIFGPGSSEIDYSKKTYLVPQGICGRASVTIKPARGALVAFLKAQGIGYSGHYGGWTVSGHHFDHRLSQSYEQYCAAAKAAAAVFSKYGVTAYVDTWLD